MSPTADGFAITDLERGERVAAARVLGDAFLDDPVWSWIGPRRRGRRQLANRVAYHAILVGSMRHEARIRTAREPGAPDGEILGISVAFDPGEWPIPDSATLLQAGWLLIAGPAPVRRGLRIDREMRSTHISHPHVYLWFLATAPAHQGRGVGRALLDDLHSHAAEIDTPCYLEASKEDNVPYYERSGYEVIGEVAVPDAPKLWRMERPGV